MQKPKKLPAILLALLMVFGTVLVIGPGQARPVGAAQDAAIDLALGADAPHGEWETMNEVTTWFMHSNEGSYGGNVGDDFATAGAHISEVIPARSGYDGSAVAIFGPTFLAADRLVFPQLEENAARDDLKLFGFNGDIWVMCDGDFALGISAILIHQSKNAETGSWEDVGDIASANFGTVGVPFPAPGALATVGREIFEDPGAITIDQYSGENIFASPVEGTGYTIPAGDRIALGFEIFGSSECAIAYDSYAYESHVAVWGDTARVNTWLEDLDGTPTDGFPAAASAGNDARTMDVKVIQASAWGKGALMDNTYARRSGTNYPSFPVSERDAIEIWDDVEDIKVYDASGQERAYSWNLLSHRSNIIDAGTDTIRLQEFSVQYPSDAETSVYRLEFQSLGTPRLERPWQVDRDFAIGVKGISLDLVAGEGDNHLINRGEATEFRFSLKNLGFDDDLVSVTPSQPGGGWTAEINPGLVSLGGGKSTFLTLDVTSPDTAVLNQPKVITITAASQFDEVSPVVATVQVTPTATIKHEVEIDAVRDNVAIRPGESRTLGATLINRGYALDHFVIAPQVPSDASTWGVAVTPLSSQLVAHGRQEIAVTITAPLEAEDGFSFDLDLDARRIGDASVTDTATINVEVFVVEGFLLDVLDDAAVRSHREIGPTGCVEPSVNLPDVDSTFDCVEGTEYADADYDNSAIHRVRLHNVGDKEAAYHVEAFWDKGATDDERDEGTCNAGSDFIVIHLSPSADGVPDGWRFNYGDGVGTPLPGAGNPQRGESRGTGFSGYVPIHDTADPLIVPARSSTDLYFEIGYVEGDACPNDGGTQAVSASLSSAAALAVRVNSTSEPGLVKIATLTSGVDESGGFVAPDRYPGAVHDTHVEVAYGSDEEQTSTGAGQPAVFELRAINTGNELDDLIIDVSDSEGGWTYKVAAIPGSHVPATLVCDPPQLNGLRLRCGNVGIYNEVALRVTATPDATVRIGDVADFEVLVRSGDDASIHDTIDLSARLSGMFDYEIELPNNDLEAAVGDAVDIPFTIVNRGTEGDTYDIALHSGDLSYDPRLSATSVFVPGGHSYTGTLSLEIPADATVGQKKLFELFVDSPNVAALKPDLFVTPIAASTLQLTAIDGGSPTNDIVIGDRGIQQPVTFRASDPTGSTSSVTFTVDPQSLPRGWLVTPSQATVALAGSGTSVAETTFQVTAPEDALGTSRVPLRVQATTVETPARARAADVIMSVQSQFGLSMDVAEGTEQTIAAGSDAVYTVTVTNNGLASDTAVLSTSGNPVGWTSQLSPVTVPLGPLQSTDVTLRLVAPASALPGTTATTLLQANSLTDTSASSLLELRTTVGVFALTAEGPGDVVRVAPQESVTRVIHIENNGTVPDQVRLTPGLLSLGLADDVEFTIEPQVVELDPGQGVDAVLTVKAGGEIPPEAEILFDIEATSLLDEAASPATATGNATVRVLDYVKQDIDGDGSDEYAFDRDLDGGNGFEAYRENTVAGGVRAEAVDVTAFLNAAARTAFTAQVAEQNGNVTMVLLHNVDGDQDGRIDHFLDRNGDGLPDIYWDADDRAFDDLTVLRDIDADGILDYFMSLDADDDLDAVYNLRSGRFTYLLQLQIDGDGELDYVVDKNGDGTRNPNEAVLLSNNGNLVSIVKVDMTGNGDLDDLVDEDGDGVPDHFVPAGSSDGISIKVKDVTGDGVNDWTYDADGDGREDSYYNPQDGSVGTIDVAENFVELIKEYWYVLVLFGLVSVLFVVLVAVTRR